MLKLRRGRVLATDPLTVEVGGEERRAWADESLVGPCEPGDEVVVNTEAVDLGLGSGGFDVVHVNLTRGLEAPGGDGTHVIKLNYTSLQHPVEPVEGEDEDKRPRTAMPVLVIALHGHLAPAAWAAAAVRPGARIGFVQSPGGALPGALSRDVDELRGRGLLCGHLTAASAYGGEGEAISVIGALDAGRAAARVGRRDRRPGPGHPRLGEPIRTRRDRRARRTRTPRLRSSCRPSSARAFRALTSARAIAGSATTPPRSSNCSWRPFGSRSPRPSSRAGRCSATRRRRRAGPRGRRSTT